MTQTLRAPDDKPTLLPPERAFRMSDTFDIWRLRIGDAYAVRLDIDASTLAEAKANASACCSHKDVLFIRETLRAARTGVALHAYVVRQGKREYRVNHETGVPGYVAPLKLDHLFSLPVNAFDPLQPWTWTPGADVVGIDRTLIEHPTTQG